jgi:hypothetical protein
MKKQTDLLATLAGTIIFNFIFWQERLALNLLLYSVLILTVIFLDGTRIKQKKTVYAAIAHLFAAILVVYNNSDLTIISWYLSLAIFIGFAYVPLLRSIFFAIGAAVLQAIAVPVTLSHKIGQIKVGNFSLKPIFSSIKYIVIPIFLVSIFGTIYGLANPAFGKYIEIIFFNIGDFISRLFNFFFADISFARILFSLLGLFCTAALFIFYKNDSLMKLEIPLIDKLLRIRKPRKQHIPPTEYQYQSPPPKRKMLGIKVENIIGIISFSALNLLLLSLNIVDIFSLWLKKRINQDFNYSAELHEGTNALICSIVLAMIVILYFFRSNINFYQKNKTIRLLAYIWMCQNIFLITSVFLRDYNYIDFHGLTYKRIGVLVFLLLCIIGLVTVYLKVKHKKTLFYLLKTNGLVWYILLLFFGLFNWDQIIMQYNINNQYSIVMDLPHFRKMSDKIIPTIDSQRQRSKQGLIQKDNIESQKELEHLLDLRIDWFEERYQKTSWLSWNYRDWQTHNYLKQKNQAIHADL